MKTLSFEEEDENDITFDTSSLSNDNHSNIQEWYQDFRFFKEDAILQEELRSDLQDQARLKQQDTILQSEDTVLSYPIQESFIQEGFSLHTVEKTTMENTSLSILYLMFIVVGAVIALFVRHKKRKKKAIQFQRELEELEDIT